MKITIEVDPTLQESVLKLLLGGSEPRYEPNTDKAPEPAAQTEDVDTDAMGVPWDERIHSSSRAKTAKGIWARRKNISDELYEGTLAELKALMSVTDNEQVPPPAPFELVIDDTPPPPPQSEITYPQFAQIITKAISDSKITNQQIGLLLRDMGIPTFASIAHRVDLIPSILSKLSL